MSTRIMETCQSETADDPACTFYVSALGLLQAAGIPFLVGGAFAYERYSKIHRESRELELFLRSSDVPKALALFEHAGYRTDRPFPHWLGRVHCGHRFIDLIFSSGNGVAQVDDQWFEHSVEHEVLGQRLRLCPPEEMIWSKAFIQERECFDGADVLHVFRAMGSALDWERLLMRFGDHWPVLLGHLVMFRYVYPNRRHAVPDWVTDELTQRFVELPAKPNVRVCRGTLLSREQYRHDVDQFGYEDARVEPHGPMTPEEAEIWTAAIEEK